MLRAGAWGALNDPAAHEHLTLGAVRLPWSGPTCLSSSGDHCLLGSDARPATALPAPAWLEALGKALWPVSVVPRRSCHAACWGQWQGARPLYTRWRSPHCALSCRQAGGPVTVAQQGPPHKYC